MFARFPWPRTGCVALTDFDDEGLAGVREQHALAVSDEHPHPAEIFLETRNVVADRAVREGQFFGCAAVTEVASCRFKRAQGMETGQGRAHGCEYYSRRM